MSEFAVDAASSLLNTVSQNAGKPYLLNFSNKSATADITVDADKFATQLVEQINQTLGTDANTKTLNVDEFTRFASGDKFEKLDDITDPGQKALVEATFNEISGNRSTATIQDVSNYVRERDGLDGKTDGQGVLNFLI